MLSIALAHVAANTAKRLISLGSVNSEFRIRKPTVLTRNNLEDALHVDTGFTIEEDPDTGFFYLVGNKSEFSYSGWINKNYALRALKNLEEELREFKAETASSAPIPVDQRSEHVEEEYASDTDGNINLNTRSQDPRQADLDRFDFLSQEDSKVISKADAMSVNNPVKHVQNNSKNQLINQMNASKLRIATLRQDIDKAKQAATPNKTAIESKKKQLENERNILKGLSQRKKNMTR